VEDIPGHLELAQAIFVKELKMRIVFVTSFPPRKCGIATFARNLVESLEEIDPSLSCEVVAISDRRYNYGRRVKFEIEQENLKSFLKAVDYIKKTKTDLINIQHQFLLYGEKGKFTVPFLRKLKECVKVPLVTTIHTLPSSPSPEEKEAIREIGILSSKVIIMIDYAKAILRKLYGMEEENIEVISHPVPLLPRLTTKEAKSKLGLSDKVILCSFGLLRRDKGLEYVIEALPGILRENPKVLYLIIGKTHPHHKKREGESYREELKLKARGLGVEKHVKFINKFLSLKELSTYLAATDVYLTSHIEEDQVSSGSLIYGLSLGKVCLSTPYPYAREVLACGKGLFIKFRNASSIIDKVNMVLKNDDLMKSIQYRAYKYGRTLSWPRMARKYLKLFKSLIF